MVDADTYRHDNVGTFRHLANPLQHLWRRPGSWNDDHLGFGRIGEGVVRHDSHSTRTTNRLRTLRHDVTLKRLHVLHGLAPDREKGKGEDLHGADKINRFSAALTNHQSDRYF